MTERIKADICVIGAGSGGLSVAAGAAQMGARAVLVEGAEMGGDCLNTGCVPSKALLASAAEAQRSGARFGVTRVEPQADYAAAMEHVEATIAAIAPHDSQERFESLGVRVIRAWGRFTSPSDLAAGDAVITARRFVIATGSRPFVPPIPGLETVPYLTNETLWSLRERPARLLVIGGGPIGMELAQAHRRLGCEVTVIEAATVLNREDPELAAILLDRLRAEGVEIVAGAKVASVTGQGGAIRVEVEGGRTFEGTHLLVAAGRVPNTESLNLDAAGVETNKSGIRTDARLRTTNRRIYAIGDVAGRGQFTHLAGYHAGVVVRSAVLGLPARARHDHIPRATYTDPELAHVGLTEAEARKRHGDKLTVLRAPLSANDRAQATARTEGMVKVMAVGGRPVGVSIVGPEAGELIAPWALAMANGLKLSAFANTVLPYPTLSEASKRAASTYFTPKLFDNPWVKRVVGFVQRFIP
ncbi:dihydrolipoyl dehydrogenase family protein [Ostreiculturibacter nitratireducens]|uniref:dihydrolipoyl dehydrogenase family protein n=1 Tax=Ostreiculturibacter nitratireducens TaxID=3075226 RepID=UPI0031B5A05E